jgi:hypothetical protein
MAACGGLAAGPEAESSMGRGYRTDVQLSSKKVFTVFKKGVIF